MKSLSGYDYLECVECHAIRVVNGDPDLEKWALKLSLVTRKPILGVLPAICPECQLLDSELRIESTA